MIGQVHVRLDSAGNSHFNLNVETIAAIDIGSNAIRLIIGETDPFGDIRILKKVREPVRLGEDSFGSGEISAKTFEKATTAFLKFKDLLSANGVRHVKAVATSALREARNRDSFVQEIKRASGIPIEVIDGIEEGRLIFSAVAHRVNLEDSTALLIDIGGGSVELTVAIDGSPVGTQTFKLGTVRLLQLLQQRGLKEKNLEELIAEQIGPARSFLQNQTRKGGIDFAIGTGGNLECLGKLRVSLLHKSSIFSMTRAELNEIVTHLQSLTVKERIQYLRLRPDRADVVIPAALVTKTVMEIANIERLSIPYVGLRDGLLAELNSKVTR